MISVRHPIEYSTGIPHGRIYFKYTALNRQNGPDSLPITLVRTPEPLTSTRNTAFQVHEAQDSPKGTQSPIHTINTSTNSNFILTIDF